MKKKALIVTIDILLFILVIGFIAALIITNEWLLLLLWGSSLTYILIEYRTARQLYLTNGC